MGDLSYHDEGPLGIARSSYADMLHDDERNHAYNVAIRATVHHLVRSKELNPKGDRFYNCCDVGVGSGLLSMMTIRAFRELNYPHFHVTGYEEYPPMAKCAAKVIEANNMHNDITIVVNRVQDVVESPKFDLLTAELLDTELIGEGCLEAYEHVRSRLCSPDCIFIPTEATTFIQLISSRYLYSRQIFNDIKCTKANSSIDVAKKYKSCCGLGDIDDLQMHNIPDLIELSRPEKVFEFKFGSITKSNFREDQSISINLIETVPPDPPMILMWWAIKMYDKSLFYEYLKDTEDASTQHDDKIDVSFETLSCAPSWVRENPEYGIHFYKKRDDFVARLYGRDVWREHWIRGVYTIGTVEETRRLVGKESGHRIEVYAFHDLVSLWFELDPASASKYSTTCNCGAHRVLSRSELAFLNEQDGDIAKMILSMSTQDEKQTCLSGIGDFPGGYLELHVPRRDQVVDDSTGALEQREKWMIQFVNSDQFAMDERLYDHHLQGDICWLYLLNRLLNAKHIFDTRPFLGLQVYCAPVILKNLSRICDRVGTCQGFDLSHLDDEIISNSLKADNSVDSIYLWEYESEFINRDETTCIYSMRWNSEKDPDFLEKKTIELPTFSKPGRALVFWADLELTRNKISTGPKEDLGQSVEMRGPIQWNRNYKQLVYFMRDDWFVAESCEDSKISIQVELSRKGLNVRRL